VTDRFGNPVPNAVLTFTIVSGAADFAGQKTTAATTDAVGEADAPVALHATGPAGIVSVSATTPGENATAVGITFMETITAIDPARADLSLSITAPVALWPDETGAVRTTVTNHGPSGATRVMTGVRIPCMVTVIGTGAAITRLRIELLGPTTLAAHKSFTYTVKVKATAHPPCHDRGRSRILRIAGRTVSATADPRLANNVAMATIRMRLRKARGCKLGRHPGTRALSPRIAARGPARRRDRPRAHDRLAGAATRHARRPRHTDCPAR
jgi:Domain of unknown function DUF11